MTDKEIEEMLEHQNIIRGYVYPYGGNLKDYWFENTPANIAGFIMQNGGAREIIITDAFDGLILNTFGEFINRCTDRALLAQIMQHLSPMQMGDMEPKEVKTITNEDLESYFHRNAGMKMGEM